MLEPMDMAEHLADSQEQQVQANSFPFRLVPQQGLVASENYKEVTQCLRAQYAPEGNQLEWQAKFQRCVQNSGEQLVEYVGHLRMLADRAYPRWTMDQRLELVRNQFIQGVHSSSTQL